MLPELDPREAKTMFRRLASGALAFVITFAAAASLPAGVASRLDVVQDCPSESSGSLTFSTKRTVCTNVVLDCDDLALHASLAEEVALYNRLRCDTCPPGQSASCTKVVTLSDYLAADCICPFGFGDCDETPGTPDTFWYTVDCKATLDFSVKCEACDN